MVPGHILRSKIMDQVGGSGRGIATVSLGLELLVGDPCSNEVQFMPPNQNFSLCNQSSWVILKWVKCRRGALLVHETREGSELLVSYLLTKYCLITYCALGTGKKAVSKANGLPLGYLHSCFHLQ